MLNGDFDELFTLESKKATHCRALCSRLPYLSNHAYLTEILSINLVTCYLILFGNV